MQITDYLRQLTDAELRNAIREAFEKEGPDSARGETTKELADRFEKEPVSSGHDHSRNVENLVCREAARRFLFADTPTKKPKAPRPKNLTPRVIKSLTLPQGWTNRRYWHHHNIEVLSRPGGGEVTVDFDGRLFALGATRPLRRTDKDYGGNAWKRNLLKDAIEALEAEQRVYEAMLGKT